MWLFSRFLRNSISQGEILILGKLPERKMGAGGRSGIGNIRESANDLFFPVTHSNISLGRRRQTYWEKQSSAFSHTLQPLYAILQRPRPPSPQGIHHPAQRGNQPDATRSLVPFSLLSYPCCTLQWKHWFLFIHKGSLNPMHSHHTAILRADENNEPWPREGTGCGCASRAGVQVASPCSRGAKGQETCGARGAEEKVGSPDLVFLMTRKSKRKAGGYRKWLSLTAPGECGKAAHLCVFSWPAGAMLCRPNGLRKGSSIQSPLRTLDHDLSFSFFFPY